MLLADFDFTYSLSWVLRWWHVVFGVAWIGLLYYFNFVQVPSFPKMEGSHRNGAIDKLVPQALWYFRYAAVATALTGLVLIGLNATDLYSLDSNAGHSIYMGALLGLVMLANVWLVIWPNQQKIIANARGLLEGKPADPNLGTAPRKALLASRTNAIFSIPMLMFMTATSHFVSQIGPNGRLITWILLIAFIAVFELSALGYIGGLEGPLTKPLAAHRNIAHIGVPVALLLIGVWSLLGGSDTDAAPDNTSVTVETTIAQ
jgi:uncharacterized membrane protein